MLFAMTSATMSSTNDCVNFAVTATDMVADDLPPTVTLSVVPVAKTWLSAQRTSKVPGSVVVPMMFLFENSTSAVKNMGSERLPPPIMTCVNLPTSMSNAVRCHSGSFKGRTKHKNTERPAKKMPSAPKHRNRLRCQTGLRLAGSSAQAFAGSAAPASKSATTAAVSKTTVFGLLPVDADSSRLGKAGSSADTEVDLVGHLFKMPVLVSSAPPAETACSAAVC
mmetsp:Transcript_120111/g.299620  ORF Transcript_120111/g.299620 Transcript_120111/m.299620 type:complete len:223 (+) Transcript_120111:285-953(+)